MKILVIEDELKILNSIKKGLEQENHNVDIASDGEDGLDFALSEGYDLIILDLMLPSISGLDICKSLREKNIQTPILMLTAKDQIKDKVMGLNCGADDYLTKPFDFEELIARIKALSRRPKNQTKNILQYEDLTLDTVTYEVKLSNKTINLSKKEYMLLEYLLRNKGKTLTKEQIMDNVWNFDSNILPNTVEVYIGYLRNKLDKPSIKDSKYIKTIRGFGYRIG